MWEACCCFVLLDTVLSSPAVHRRAQCRIQCRTPSALLAMNSPKRLSCSSIRVEIHFRSHQALLVQIETPRIESCSHQGATVDLLDHWRVRRWLSNGIAKVTTSASDFISCFGSMSKCVATMPKLVITSITCGTPCRAAGGQRDLCDAGGQRRTELRVPHCQHHGTPVRFLEQR